MRAALLALTLTATACAAEVTPAEPVPPPPAAPVGPCCVFSDGSGQACECSAPTFFATAEEGSAFWCTSTPTACAPTSSCITLVDGGARSGWCKP